MTVIGEMQDKVRYQSLSVITFQPFTAFVLQRLLRIKLLALLQFQIFQQLFQFQFSEVALHLYLACQSSCQPISRLPDSDTLLHINLDGLVESGQRLSLLFLRLVKRFLHILQTSLQGVDNLRHLFLVLHPQFFLTLLQHLL